MNNWIKFDKDDKTTWPDVSAHGNAIGVICYSKNRFIGQMFFNRTEKWWSTTNILKGNYSAEFITHWQPLPEPPED